MMCKFRSFISLRYRATSSEDASSTYIILLLGIGGLCRRCSSLLPFGAIYPYAEKPEAFFCGFERDVAIKDQECGVFLLFSYFSPHLFIESADDQVKIYHKDVVVSKINLRRQADGLRESIGGIA